MIGETLGEKYRILRVLGAGGMGTVYEAERIGTLERVAIKLINTEKLGAGGEASSRFRREARAASAVESPHIVRILDSGTDEATGNLYIVMDYLGGEDLQHLMDRVGPLPPGAVLRIAGQILLGLQKAHEAGIVHRDIKPLNIFLGRGDGGEITVTILDFGIAKIRADVASVPHTTGLTDTGGFLGSPLYMSPEQVQNSKDVDQRTDLWSLGTALYAALAGDAPHQDKAEFVGKLIVAICGTPAPLIQERAPWISPEIAELVHRALAVDREERWPTAAAMLDAVRRLAPEGFDLHEAMLVTVAPAERAATAARVPARGARIVVDPSTSPPALGDGSTRLVATARGQAKVSSRRGGALLAGAALTLGLGVAMAYRLARSPLRESAPIGAGAATAALPAPEPGPPSNASASAPSAEPERARRNLLDGRPPDATVEIDGTRAEVRDGGVAIEGKIGRVPRVLLKVEPAPRSAAPAKSASLHVPSAASSKAAPPAEGNLMPADPPP